MATFAKPENALKRAEELIHVGQKQAALQALHDVITSKRYRSWQKPLERIMMKYVELCVDLRKGRFAKDGLIQYRIVCQQVNVSSLEDVIKHFMQLSNEKAEQARGQAQALEDALDVEDLEADKRPEDLMLSYVSGEKGKDRSDREVVTPWFKFLWETYRTVLEILRNNSKLEALYAMTAHKAFQFCKQYKRTTEFRRLCEIIRNHLANLNKYRDQRDRPDLTAPESLQLYLDTRVEQLKTATDLSLWQEAFRSVEDVYGLMSMVKKMPKPSIMVVYYAKLTEIFWISDSHLYHAYAWLKLFNLQKSYNKNLSQKDLQLIASSVLLAALSVTPYDQKYGASHLETENEKERNMRMASLVNFSLESKRENKELPSRASLFTELASKGVIACASQEVKDLYNLLEHDFLPLDLASKVQPLLSKISKIGGKLSSASSVPEIKLSQYISSLEKLTTLRVLQQISVDAVKRNFLAMKVNHLSGAVHFGTVVCGSLALLISVEKEEEMKRLSKIKKTVDEEKMRLIHDQKTREMERIRKEEEEKEKHDAEEKLKELMKKTGKKIVVDGDLSKQAIMELALNEQLKERMESEKKLQKLAKTMDHLERAKRQEEAPLIEQAFQKRQEEEKILHEQEQLREIELSKQHHAGDLQEKNRLSRMLEHKNAFQDRIIQRREAEFSHLKKERDERINQLISSRKRERETVRKLMHYLNMEEQRILKIREDEEAKKHEERKKREEAERKAKLDAIAAKQQQRERELEEKARQMREAALRGTEPAQATSAAPTPPAREPTAAPAAAAAAATTLPTSGKYVPKWKRGGDSGSGSAGGGSMRPSGPPEHDRWGPREDRPRPDVRPLRQDGPPVRQDAPPARQDAPATDRWRPGSRLPSSSSSSSSTWGRSRN
ncbi:hypothetical protein PR202_ga23668 [Eleusine coracana subsp. coracana]|uniref:Eukaryotic translation initiation factor 3 subunit A n=1 Tax=Eleusine coracana subsp. coracana TaxID=191504 RepID=A0AAV5D5U4_ELECO|nr:hypothetical protein PR202_ga23668 [Eleusine coracana subsp. coracana]